LTEKSKLIASCKIPRSGFATANLVCLRFAIRCIFAVGVLMAEDIEQYPSSTIEDDKAWPQPQQVASELAAYDRGVDLLAEIAWDLGLNSEQLSLADQR
jgi:hypothetical protein